MVERALADPNLLNEKCDPSPDWLQLLLEEVELEKANQLAKDRILKQSLSIDGWRQVTPLRKLKRQNRKQETESDRLTVSVEDSTALSPKPSK